MTRKCELCGEIKQFEMFYKREAARYDRWCKECRLAEKKRRYRTTVRDQSQHALMAQDIAADKAVDGERVFQYPEGDVRMTEEEFQRVVEVFKTLKRWRDEALKNGPIPGWVSLDG